MNQRGVGRVMLGVFSVLVCLVAYFVVGITSMPKGPSGTLNDEPTEFDAFRASQKIVGLTLKAPATAKFPSQAVGVVRNGPLFTVKSYVDSQNSFGALIRTDYVVAVKHKGGSAAALGNWQVVDIRTN